MIERLFEVLNGRVVHFNIGGVILPAHCFRIKRLTTITVLWLQSACSAVACSVPKEAFSEQSNSYATLRMLLQCSIATQSTNTCMPTISSSTLYSATTVTDIDTTRERLVDCILDVREWCASRRLQLNAQKTELVWFGSAANIRKISTMDLALSVGGDVITPLEVVRDLGVYLDAELTMKHHVNRVTSNCFFSAPPTSSDQTCRWS